MRDLVEAEHVTEIQDAGSYCGWRCKTCGKTSRHLLPYHRTARNARAHERKAKLLGPPQSTGIPVALAGAVNSIGGLTSCDLCGGGCSDPTCPQCYPAPDAERATWRAVWSSNP